MINLDYQEKLFKNRINRSKDKQLPFECGCLCGIITDCIREDDCTLSVYGYATEMKKRFLFSIKSSFDSLPYKYEKKYNIVSLKTY